MTAILACSLCHTDMRAAGMGTCPDCGPRHDEPLDHEHCRLCGLGWRPLDDDAVCSTCATREQVDAGDGGDFAANRAGSGVGD